VSVVVVAGRVVVVPPKMTLVSVVPTGIAVLSPVIKVFVSVVVVVVVVPKF
jgi:hypothetical protein